jgi:hypothetical protein
MPVLTAFHAAIIRAITPLLSRAVRSVQAPNTLALRRTATIRAVRISQACHAYILRAAPAVWTIGIFNAAHAGIGRPTPPPGTLRVVSTGHAHRRHADPVSAISIFQT